MQFFRIILFAGILMQLVSTNVLAQYHTHNSFWLIPQFTAPTAMSGHDYHQISAHYQKQALSSNLGSRSMILSGQFSLYNKGNAPLGMVGANIIRQESGATYLFATSGAMLTYNYTVRLSGRHHLIGGIQGGYFSRSIDWSKVTTSNQFADGQLNPNLDHGERFNDYRSQAFTSNIGLGYYLTDARGQQRFHIGGGMINANKGRFTYLENDNSQAESVRLVLYSDLRLISNPFFELGAKMYWQQEGKLNDYVGGLQLNKGINPRKTVADEHLGLGLYYSPDQSATLAMQFMRESLVLGISYTLPMGNRNLWKIQNTAEFTLGWRMSGAGRKGSFYGGSQRGETPRFKAKKSLSGSSNKFAPAYKNRVNKKVARAYKNKVSRKSATDRSQKFSRKVSAYKAKAKAKKPSYKNRLKSKAAFSKNYKKANKGGYKFNKKNNRLKSDKKRIRRMKRRW